MRPAALPHYTAVVWTAIGGTPQKMGTLVLSDDRMVMTYDEDYLASGLPRMSLIDDVATEVAPFFEYPVTERMPMLPRLRALVPGNNPRNLQRAHYLKALQRKMGTPPAKGIDTEWALLLMGGHGGVGHVDVFQDDRAALAWYGREINLRSFTANMGRSELWRFLREQILDESNGFTPHDLRDVMGNTPSVGGMIPKLLVSMDVGRDDTTLYPPGAPGKVDVLLKIEPPEYQGLLALEAMCLDIHREHGLDTPGYRYFEQEDLRFLAVERFDRPTIQPVESLFSVIATGDHRVQGMGDVMLEDLGGILRRLSQVVELAPDTGTDLFQRFILAYLTGNGDLHLENLSLLGGKNGCRLAPVYDPAPMRAWARHDLVSAIGYDTQSYPDEASVFVELGRALGLSRAKIDAIVEQSLETTRDYAERVADCAVINDGQRHRLSTIAIAAKETLQAQLRHTAKSVLRENLR